ncbi:hypothetical protein F442_15301 [Phytophthora nicotianae P10297]|uniref:SET domain-containing protein n=1 Tax=Phytophthora nicotianae P10297 TaxID=1317064 RepID=W2YP88_PHYNI|nr:hypothetical protein F442_15301 [Phytophthora nicotianae P10297]
MKIYAGCKRLYSALERLADSVPSEDAAPEEKKAKSLAVTSGIGEDPRPPRSLHEEASAVDESCATPRPTLVEESAADPAMGTTPTSSPCCREPTPSDVMPEQSQPWLRFGRGSGRVFSHPQVSPHASILSQPLSEFQLSEPNNSTDTALSSQATETESWDLSSPTRSYSSTGTLSNGAPSPVVPPPSLEAATDQAPQSVVYESPRRPRRVVEIAPHRYRYTGKSPVYKWFDECFHSDGYESNDIDNISTSSRKTSRGFSQVSPSAASIASSPGFVLLGDTSLDSARSEWTREFWSREVMVLTNQCNPDGIEFPPASTGRRNGEGCGCYTRCTALSCLNASCSRFCDAHNCTFGGDCGNSLKESPVLQISRNTRSGIRGITVFAAIPAGEVVGEYLGHLKLAGPPMKNGSANEGYMMRLKTRAKGNKYVGIDAQHGGGKIRLLNHSCNPCARFHEVQTESELTVVAVTTRDIFPGEEVTVSYGDKLWFICRCGWWGCQHRDLQHLNDFRSSP